MRLILLISLLILSAQGVSASDHLDPIPQPSLTDLSDFYAWSKEGKLYLALNTFMHPVTSEHRPQFDGSVEFRFEIRKAKLGSAAYSHSHGGEVHSHSRVSVPSVKSDYEAQVVCRPIGYDTRCEVERSDAGDSHRKYPLRQFSGLRADAFVLDVIWATHQVKSVINPAEPAAPPVPFPDPLWLCAVKGNNSQSDPRKHVPPTRNFSDVMNVLNLTVEVDIESSLGEDIDLLAISAAAYTQNESEEWVQVDRIGRPEVMNMTVGLDAIKADYNKVSTFNQTVQQKQIYGSLIRYGVLGWDRKDGKNDWVHTNTGRNELHDLIETLSLDALIVDTQKNCDLNADNYLQVELNYGETESCGGRVPAEDVIDTMFSVFTAGPSVINGESSFGDGADKAFRQPTEEFPFFAGPEMTSELGAHIQSSALAIEAIQCP
ncbi:MAG: hypothetical protein CL677_02565 [Bdellovibrionaceae bacterium]|mgnify:CR=1 FL=1|nr:hypothetical protein [Pseudobdellovibrionaceae bacterium]|tara:strand:- start:279561 stop:280856 length:1296 start_codon:yes stop_codon:yes gene_type:complete